MADIKVTVDNITVTVPEGSTLLDAAHKAGIDVPTLCYLRGINEIGACRMCVCEVRYGSIYQHRENQRLQT